MKLTPQQILLSSLLQLPLQALEQRLKQELELNPLLEESEELEETLEEVEEEEEEITLEQEEVKDEEQQVKEEEAEKEKKEEEIDWEQILNDENNYEVKTPRDRSNEEDESEWIQPQKRDLTEYLLEQLRFTSLSDEDLKIGEYIIGNLNPDGYLIYDETELPDQPAIDQLAKAAVAFRDDSPETKPISDAPSALPSLNRSRKNASPIDPVKAIAVELHTEASAVERVLRVIHTFDPPGIAARSLQECLLIQLNRREAGFYDNGTDMSIRIVKEAFEDFINHRFDKVCRQLSINMDAVKQTIHEILQLNPKPGEGYITAEQNYVTPDVLVKKVEDRFEIILNDHGVPHLRINHAYRRMLLEKSKTSKEAKDFIKNKLEAAKWLINSVYKRRDTIYRTVEAIIDLQREFFEKGKDHLKPMKLEDVAVRIGMDVSTISRATNGKYVQTDFGVFELKYFFSTAMTTSDGEDISTRQIKSMLKEIVDQENKKKPWSDEDLSRLLTERGTPIARRTVTKYREQLMIPAARLRKAI